MKRPLAGTLRVAVEWRFNCSRHGSVRTRNLRSRLQSPGPGNEDESSGDMSQVSRLDFVFFQYNKGLKLPDFIFLDYYW